jgi:hypothetical protein
MDQLQRRPWLAGLVIGIPISLVALIGASLFLGPGSLIDAGPVRAPAAAIGTLVASVVLAELAAHRNVRPWLAIVAWIGTAHAIATVLIVSIALSHAETSTLMAAAGVLFGLVLVVVVMGIPWLVGGLAWLLAVRRLVEGADYTDPRMAPGTPARSDPADPAHDDTASTAAATVPGS